MKFTLSALIGILLASSACFASELVNCSGVEGGDSYGASVAQKDNSIEVRISNISNLIKKRSMAGRNNLSGRDQYSQVSQGKFKKLLNSENSSIDANDTLLISYSLSECAINPINNKILRCMRQPRGGVDFLSEVKTTQSVSSDGRPNSSEVLEMDLTILPKDSFEDVIWMDSSIKFSLKVTDETGKDYSSMRDCK